MSKKFNEQFEDTKENVHKKPEIQSKLAHFFIGKKSIHDKSINFYQALLCT